MALDQLEVTLDRLEMTLDQFEVTLDRSDMTLDQLEVMLDKLEMMLRPLEVTVDPLERSQAPIVTRLARRFSAVARFQNLGVQHEVGTHTLTTGRLALGAKDGRRRLKIPTIRADNCRPDGSELCIEADRLDDVPPPDGVIVPGLSTAFGAACCIQAETR
jgi:hypothetical protein